jgi:hypothetical protein
MKPRFTIDGSDDLEARLDHLCGEAARRVSKAIPTGVLHALVLGGGYGRGEGGVLETETGHQPYNDLEFFVLLRGFDILNRRRFGGAVHAIAEDLSREAGIEVEFKLLGLRKLQQAPVSMFYYDLISGHRVVHGSEAWINHCDHHRAAHRIPLHEATRLLMNRCSGLLFSQERLERDDFGPAEADFVGRNLAKAKLAFGDAVLAMRGQYHWSCRERHKRLKKLDAEGGLQNFSSLLPLHEQGVAFKLHPVRTARAREDLRHELDFLKELGRDLWLHLESKRLGQPFSSVPSYCWAPHPLCPETKPLRNRLVDVRTFGLAGISSDRYPRERLLRSFPMLLWPEEGLREPFALPREQLRGNGTTLREMVRSYESLWRVYN